MITVPWEKRIICLGIGSDDKERLIADMQHYVQDKPYSETNYKRFNNVQRVYGQYSCCLDFDTITVDGDSFNGSWLSTDRKSVV